MSKFFRLILSAVLLTLVVGGNGTAGPTKRRAVPTITHGVIVGDVTASSALLWARADREATLNVVLSGGRHGAVATSSGFFCCDLRDFRDTDAQACCGFS